MPNITSRTGFVMLILILCCLSLVSSATAQTAGTGALTGTVTDASGAVIPNVTVTVTSVDTNQVRTATTGADGSYKFNLLPPGNYHVKFEAGGFNSVEVPAATINVTETEVLNRALTVGAQTQEVTVQADVETVQTASSALGTVVNTETITDLPLSTRNYTNLLAMSAGASAAVQDASLLGKGTTEIAVNGAGNAQNNYLQDGVAIDNYFSFSTGVEGISVGAFAIPNPDSIAEFKIQTSTYDAGYGRNPGANVNVVTRSGTNNFHGAGFEFFRNTVLNANNWFFDNKGEAKPVLNANQYGGVLGGPIKKDKLFFFVSYQQSGQKNGLSGYGLATVNLPPIPAGSRGTCTPGFADPTVGCNTAAQAFIKSLATNMSPAAGCPNAGAAAFKVATSGSINVACPANPVGVTGPATLYNVNPVAISILQLTVANGGYYIPGSGTSGFSSVPYSNPATFSDYNGMGNFDYVINAKNTLSGRYEYEQDPLNAPFPASNATVATQYLPGSPITNTKWNHSAILKLTTILTPNLLNEARISYQRYVTGTVTQNPFTNSQVGITDLQPGIDQLTNYAISGVFTVGPNSQFGGLFTADQFEWADQISWTHGKHSVRAGFEAQRIPDAQAYPSLAIGDPTISTWADFLIGRCASVVGCANPNGSTASNIANVGNATVNSQANLHYVVDNLDGFIQDDFKVYARLTVNMGIRWEYDGPVIQSGGLVTRAWASLLNTVPVPPSTPTAGTLAGFFVPSNYAYPLPAGLYRNDNPGPNASTPRDAFAPRLGFSWQPTKSNRWVVRSGAGYFYDTTPYGSSRSNPAVGSPVASGATTSTLADPWVLPLGIIPGPAGTYGFQSRWVTPGNLTSTAASSNLSGGLVPQILKMPLTYEWNLNTQYEFLPTWVLEVGYVGSLGIHQQAQSVSGAQGQAAAVPANVALLVGPNCASCALYGVTTNTVNNVVLRVPYPGLSAQATESSGIDQYKYNGLQATLRKQLSHGLQLQAAYTWSRAFIQQPYGINSYPYIVEQYGLNPNYRPERLVLNYVWNLPLGHPQGIVDKLVEGWTWSGVTTIQDGVPMNITDSTGGSIFFGGSGANSTANFCPGMTNADVPTSGTLDQRVLSGLAGGPGYLNGKAQGVFCVPPTIGNGTGFGNAGLGLVLGPGQNNWDMSLAKTTSIREGQTIQFRAEFFNTFNHPQFSNPSTGVTAATTYGHITTTSVSPRIIQFALKYSF